MTRRLLLLVPILTVAGLTTWFAISYSGQQDESPQDVITLLTVPVVAVEASSSYDRRESYLGRVEAARSSDLGFERPGRLIDVLVDEGEAVEKDAVLARLDDATLQSQREEILARKAQSEALLAEMVAGPRVEVIEAAQATVKRFEAELARAKLSANRQKQLVRQQATSAEDYDQARFEEEAIAGQLGAARANLTELERGTRQEQIDAQRAIVRQLEAELATIDVEIDKTILRAPFAGVISDRYVDEGVVVSVGQAVLRLLERERLEVRVGLAREALDSLAATDPLIVDVHGTTVAASRYRVLPDRNVRTRTVPVLLALDEPPAAVRVDDVATLELRKPIVEPGYWLPLSALTESHHGLWNCYVARPVDGEKETGRVEARQVEILHTETDQVYVRGAVEPNEFVIIDGLQRIVPGQDVRIQRGGSAL